MESIYLTTLFLFLGIGCDSKCSSNFTRKHGEIYLIGLFPVRGGDPQQMRNETIAWVEAMTFTINKKNTDLKRDLFGYMLYDTCAVGNNDVLTEAVVNVVLDSTAEQCVCTSKNVSLKNIVGIVGPAESSSSIYVNQLLTNDDIPIISYSATSVLLNDKVLYPNFFRTVPPDSHQSRFIVDLLMQFDWKYVSLIAADNAYGRNGIDYLDKEFLKLDICVNIQATLSDSYNEADHISVLKNVMLDDRSRVIIVWGGFLLVKKLLLNAQKLGLINFTWIISEATGLNPWLLDFSKSFQGNILITVQTAGYDKEFENHFLNITYKNARENPWLRELFHANGTTNENSDIKVADLQRSFDFSRISFVENAVKVLINSYLSYRQFEHNATFLYNRTRFTDIIKKVTFQGFLNETFSFNENQNPEIADFQLFKTSEFERFIRVADWSSLDNIIYFNRSLLSNVTSICSLQCPPGQFAVLNENKRCCWKCVQCFPNHAKHTSGQHKCRKCAIEHDYYSNADKTKCIQLKTHYWSIININSNNYHFVVIVSISAVCAIVTIFYMVSFIRNRKSPVITSSNFRLSILQQFIHLMLFAFPFFMLGEESLTKCYFRSYVTGICFTLIYALALLKVTDFVTIFSTKRKFTKKDIFKLRSRGILICTGVILTYIAITIVSETRWPLQLSDEKDMIRYTIHTFCYTREFSVTHIVFSIIIFLACAIQSFRGRKLPGNYNEAKYLAFALFSSTLVKITSLFIINSLTNQDEKMSLQCVAVILSNFLILLILYSFRVYIIWFEPDKNTHQYFRKISLASIHSSISRMNSSNSKNNFRGVSFYDESTPNSTRFRIVENVDERTNSKTFSRNKLQRTLGIDNKSFEIIQEFQNQNSILSKKRKLGNVKTPYEFKEISVHNRKLSIIKEKNENKHEVSWLVVMDKDPDFSISAEAVNIWNTLIKERVIDDTHL